MNDVNNSGWIKDINHLQPPPGRATAHRLELPVTQLSPARLLDDTLRFQRAGAMARNMLDVPGIPAEARHTAGLLHN
jgi:hypothetical protein